MFVVLFFLFWQFCILLLFRHSASGPVSASNEWTKVLYCEKFKYYSVNKLRSHIHHYYFIYCMLGIFDILFDDMGVDLHSKPDQHHANCTEWYHFWLYIYVLVFVLVVIHGFRRKIVVFTIHISEQIVTAFRLHNSEINILCVGANRPLPKPWYCVSIAALHREYLVLYGSTNKSLCTKLMFLRDDNRFLCAAISSNFTISCGK